MDTHPVSISQKESFEMPTRHLSKYNINYVESSPDNRLLYIIRRPTGSGMFPYVMVFQAHPLKFLSKSWSLEKVKLGVPGASLLKRVSHENEEFLFVFGGGRLQVHQVFSEDPQSINISRDRV